MMIAIDGRPTADSRAGTREVERAREGVGLPTRRDEPVGSRARSSARDGDAAEGGGDRPSIIGRSG